MIKFFHLGKLHSVAPHGYPVVPAQFNDIKRVQASHMPHSQ